MYYVNELTTSNSRAKSNTESVKTEPSYIITLNNKELQENNLQHSLVFAAKPLILLAALFGSQLVRYEKDDIAKSRWVYKLYSVFVAVGYLTLNLTIRPASWQYTRTDHPLNILTKSYGMFNIVEVMYSILVISISNTNNFVKLFKKLNDIDQHFCFPKVVFMRRRCISIFFALVPILQVQSTFWLVKFNIQNIGAHATFFLITLQGSVINFIVWNIYLKLLCLNKVLIERVKLTATGHKNMIFRNTILDSIINIIFGEPKLLHKKNVNYCWFELMEIYDKLADCINLFNKVLYFQVFFMYNTWLFCTLLMICRSLSPSIKYSEVFLSDVNLYLCINCRPIFLAVVCEMFIKQRKKTLSLLLHILINLDNEHAYFSQVETMIMLVKSRKLEISANVFTVNVPTVMNFAGRIISYIVLVIQYFYNYVFIK